MTECAPLVHPHTRGDGLTIPLEFNGDISPRLLGLIDTLDSIGAGGWTGQVRETLAAEDPLCTFTFTSDRVGNVLTVLASVADTAALLANTQYPFDLQVEGDGLIGPKTFLSGASIFVTPDVTR